MKRILVVCYSQTGQLRRCADTLVAPLKRAGCEVDVVVPRPKTPYPFPWSFGAFIDVFADCRLGRAPEMEPESLKAPHDRYDLVVVAYQVWYLAPALPIVGWLESEAASVLKDTPVVALCACRNMWQRAFVDLKRLVAAKGGRLVDHVTREDRGPLWATLWSTPRWMLTGDRAGATGLLPLAGVSDDDIASLAAPGEKLQQALEQGPIERSVLAGAEAKVNRRYVMPELVGVTFFSLWVPLIARTRSWGRLWRWLVPRVWFFTFCSLLPLIVPIAVVTLFIRLLARGWFEGKVDEVTA